MTQVRTFIRALLACAVVVVTTGSLVGSGSAFTEGWTGRIVFTARAGGLGTGPDIFVVNANGTSLRRLTQDGESQSPTWSPDGKSVAFIHFDRATSANALVRMPAMGGAATVLVNGPSSAFLSDPAWSPNGKWIAYGGVNEIDFYPASKGQPTPPPIQGFADHPSWSPNSRQLAYGGLITTGHGSIFVTSVDGVNPRDVSQAPVDDETPVWAANGKWIAMRSLNADWQQHEADSLVVINPDGTGRRTVLSGGVIFPVASSPSGNAVLVLRKADPSPTAVTQLWIVPISGGAPRPVPGTKNAASTASWHR